jgi:hypothetical protein
MGRMQGKEEPDDQNLANKMRLTRRQVLGMGLAVGSGIVLGLASCEQEGGPATSQGASSGTGPASGTNGATASATSRQTSPATAGGATPSTTPSPTNAGNTGSGSAPATSRAATTIGATKADLGAELFPDERGKALAHIEDAPVILVPRTDWTQARPRMGLIVPMAGVSRITVHHTAGQMTTDAWVPTASELEGIRGFHAGTGSTDRNWADIAYHFVVDRAGRVWQGRPLAYQGAHARQHNQHNMGIVLLGDFSVQTPTAAQLTALREFTGFVRTLYKVPLERVYTHGELGDTECPGKMLQDYMNRARGEWGAAEGAAWKAPTSKPAAD